MDPLKVLEFFKNEGSVLWSAPVTFLTSAFLFAMAGYLFGRKLCADKVDALNERIKTKDDQIAGLKERVGMMPAPGSQFSQLTHKEFQKEVMDFVRGLRADLAKWRQLERRRSDGDMYAMRVASDEATRMRLFHEQGEARQQVSTHVVAEYAAKYKAKALVLRDELISRGTTVNQLERRIPAPTVSVMYEIANGTLAFETVADDLEQRATVLG